MKQNLIEKFLAAGANYWTSNDGTKRRVYVTPEMLGFHADFYKTGNLRGVDVDPWPCDDLEAISNSKAGKIFQRYAQFFYDLENNDVATTNVTGNAEITKILLGRMAYLRETMSAELATGLTVEKPEGWDENDDQKLENLMANYQKLFADAVGYNGLIISDKTVTFLGLEPDNAAHKILAGYLMRGAKNLRSVRRRDVVTDNPRFTLRTLLVRLGWKGRDTTKERISIYEKLSGDSAFRTESSKKTWLQKRGA